MLSQRMQCNLLYRYFVMREPVTIDPNALVEPWRQIFLLAEREEREYWVIEGYDPLRSAAITIANKDRDLAQRWIDAIYASAEPISFPTLAEMADALEPVSWLWEKWVPRGMLSILGAFQGAGKSYFVMDLARIVLHGPAWPDGSPLQHDVAQARVVYVDAEGIPQVNNERALALGLDTQRMYLLMAEPGEMIDFMQQHWRDRLLDLTYTVAPDLVIVDSLSTITSAGTNSPEEVAGLLTFLNGLAREFGTGLVLLHHLRKPGGGQLSLPGVSIHDFRGSTHIVAMARSVIGLSVVQQPGKQFSLNGPRHIEVVKTNLTTYPEKLEVRMEQPAEGVVRFAYGQAEPVADDEPTPEAWLLEYLEANGPTKFADLVTDAERDGFSKATLYRARKKLGSRIVDSSGRRRRDNLWALAEQIEESEEEVEAEASDDDV